MRTTLRIVAAVCLFALAGCGYVEGNYPQTQSKAPKTVPETFAVRSGSKPLVWKQDGDLRGFLIEVRPAKDTVDRLDAWAKRGGARAARELPLFQSMAEKKLAHVTMVAFFAPAYEHELRRGDLQVNFADGSSVQDEGAYLYPPPGDKAMPKSTLMGGVMLEGKTDKDMKGRRMFVFVPGEYADRKVASVAFAAQETAAN